MNPQQALLDHLYQHEIFYVDEIDRLQRQPQSVSIIAEKSIFTGGWLYLHADQSSGDWNLARLLGCPEAALAGLDRLPAEETRLLVPPEAAGLFKHLHQEPDLIFFCSRENGSEPDIKPLAAEFSLKTNFEHDLPAIYLCRSDEVCGYVRPIRQTRHFVEVYIELKPACRGKGLARPLLTKAAAEIHKLQKNLYYAVSADNKASLQTARSTGLEQTFSLCRFVKPLPAY